MLYKQIIMTRSIPFSLTVPAAPAARDEMGETEFNAMMEKGLSQAAKKASRIAAEGAVAQYVNEDATVGVIVEVNCETDFVANTDNFKNFANSVAKHIAQANPADVDALLAQKYVDDESKTISDMISDATVAIGEKISIRRFERYETKGVISTYIHLGGKVGVIVEVSADENGKKSDEVKTFAHDPIPTLVVTMVDLLSYLLETSWNSRSAPCLSTSR